MKNLRINESLQCEVATNSSECRREPAHCHITRNGNRIAKIWLNPVSIEPGTGLMNDEIETVVEFIEDNISDLLKQYELIKKAV